MAGYLPDSIFQKYTCSGVKHTKHIRCIALSLAVSIFALASIAAAAPITITVDTSVLSGISAQLAFDLIDGGQPANSVSISEFLTDGALGSALSTGGVVGDIPGTVTLSDNSFFNEYLKNITLGNSLTFTFSATGNGPLGDSFPDGFGIFLLDPDTGLSLVATDDPTGSNALALLNIDGRTLGNFEIFSSSVTAHVNPAPEPRSLLLFVSGVCLLIAFLRIPGFLIRYRAGKGV